MNATLVPTYVAALETVVNDETKTSHSSTACPKIVGITTTVPKAKAGWLCSTCIDIDEPKFGGFDHDVPNGFGGTTTRRRTKPDPIIPPSEKQLAFVRRLLTERSGDIAAEAIRTLLNQAREDGTLSRKLVSSSIDALLKIAVKAPEVPAFDDEPKPSTQARTSLPDVPEGRYAIESDGVVKFYKVDRPTEGRWAGWTFVKVQASDDFFPIKGEARRPILEAIAVDVAGASKRYGHELGSCGVCGRTLTDESSREAGIGPVCAAKMGW